VSPAPQSALTPVSGRTQFWLTVAPVIAAAAGLVALGVAAGWTKAAALVGIAVATFVYLGKFVIVTPAVSANVGFTPWELAALVVFMDVFTGCVISGNLHLLYRLPWVGPRLARLEAYGRRTLEQKPWMRRMSRLGITLFVMFPLTGTGAVGASILGRLLGIRLAWIIGCIGAGAVLGCGMMAGLSSLLAEPLMALREETWFQFLGIGVIVAIIAALGIWAARVDRRLQEEQARK
jgi:uncharacterized membrane protein